MGLGAGRERGTGRTDSTGTEPRVPDNPGRRTDGGWVFGGGNLFVDSHTQIPTLEGPEEKPKGPANVGFTTKDPDSLSPRDRTTSLPGPVH